MIREQVALSCGCDFFFRGEEVGKVKAQGRNFHLSFLKMRKSQSETFKDGEEENNVGASM